MDHEFRSVLVVVVLCIAALVGFVELVTYYEARVQAEVYQRQGIQITAWEYWWEATPAEQTVRIKHDPN